MSTANVATKPAGPIKRLAVATTVTCAPQAAVYGKCVAASYTDVKKDMCRDEFAKFKDCIKAAMKKR
ncbi:hypothetical protein BKA70DRAFT_1424910 [Coprinopsis sp. MPI-PUGE-AT-0042]|nr:hypothetical protein BKA70DRAFT_1424910 [Coprinopsis sp. MPI-PUGE-AT-0042]